MLFRSWFYLAVASHALLVALIFLLAAQLGSPRAGAIAAACAVACPLFLDSFSPALSQVPTAALAAAVWLLLLRGTGVSTALVAAALAAAAWYLRAEVLIMVPVWLWVAGPPPEGRAPRAGEPPEARPGEGGREPRWRRSAVFALGYGALCVPWLLSLRGISGSTAPIHGSPTLLYTPEFPGHFSSRAYQTELPGLLQYIAQYPASFAFRFAKDAAGFGVDLLAALGPIAAGVALAGLLLREPRDRWRSLAPALPLVIAALLQITVFACLERSPRFLVPAASLACVVIGVAAAPALDRICGRTMVAALFATLILERGVTVAFQSREAARRSPPLGAVAAAELAASAVGWPRDALILSDVPDWVAWHLDRPALLLPLWRQVDQVAADHPVAAIYLSPGALSRNVSDRETDWVRTIERSAPIPGYAGPRYLAGDARLYVREISSAEASAVEPAPATATPLGTASPPAPAPK